MTRIRTVLFVLLLIAVVAANVLVIAPEFWSTRLWEDEAYNLTVPLNLLAGHGYSSDGVLARTQTLDPFDARISTGPVVLLPVAAMLATGIDMVIGARLVMLLFYLLLLVGLWLIGRRIAGRWGGLAAAAVPVCLDTNQLPSPIQGPVDVLGEIPAAAILVFAFLVVRRRPWLAGLLLGLAIQTKLISALAAPALVLIVLWPLFVEKHRGGADAPADASGAPPQGFEAAASGLPQPTVPSLVRRGIRLLKLPIVAALAPTVLFGLVQLISLGPVGFFWSMRDLLSFLRSGGQTGFDVRPFEKVQTLFISWYVSAGVVLAMCVLAVLVGALCWRMLARSRAEGAQPTEAQTADRGVLRKAGARASDREVLLLLGGFALTLVIWCGWWLVSTHTPGWVRYAVTGLLLCVPVMAAGLVLGVQMLWQARPVSPSRGGGVVVRALAAVTVVVMVGMFGAQAWAHVQYSRVPDLGETLVSQRAASDSMAKLGEPELVSGWGPQIGAIILSGARVMPDRYSKRGATPVVVWNYDQSDASLAQLNALIAKSCAHVRLRLAHYAVCTPAGH